jgi:hypothetical protein
LTLCKLVEFFFRSRVELKQFFPKMSKIIFDEANLKKAKYSS